VKKLILTATGFVCLAGGTYFLTAAWGQDKARKEAAADDAVPHRIGVIDIDFIFQNYDKVKVESEELNAEAQQMDEKIKSMQRSGQDQFQEFKELKEGSPEKKAKEDKLNLLGAQIEAKKKSFQNDLKRSQAKMNLTIYQEIQDAVKSVAVHNNITLVVKVARNEAASASDAQRLQMMFAQPCIYHRKQDDMSDTVLTLLNKKYNRENPDAAGKITPAGGEESTGKKKKNQVKQADGKSDR
jgi:Skp family chaperone for outer membrane proteins